MDGQILIWADVAVDTVEVAAIVAALLLLLRVQRNIAALLRVIRRIDRKTADTIASKYQQRARRNEAPQQAIGNPQPEPNQPAID